MPGGKEISLPCRYLTIDAKPLSASQRSIIIYGWDGRQLWPVGHAPQSYVGHSIARKAICSTAYMRSSALCNLSSAAGRRLTTEWAAERPARREKGRLAWHARMAIMEPSR